jgi:hypothetical protein
VCSLFLLFVHQLHARVAHFYVPFDFCWILLDIGPNSIAFQGMRIASKRTFCASGQQIIVRAPHRRVLQGSTIDPLVGPPLCSCSTHLGDTRGVGQTPRVRERALKKKIERGGGTDHETHLPFPKAGARVHVKWIDGHPMDRFGRRGGEDAFGKKGSCKQRTSAVADEQA